MKLRNEEAFFQGEAVQILSFKLLMDDERYLHLGLNIQKVKEVIQCNRLSPFPNSFAPVVGIYDLRGIPVPVIDLKHSLLEISNTSSPYEEKKRLLVCEFQEILLAFVVDETDRVIRLPNSSIRPMPAGLGEKGGKFFNGIIHFQDEYIQLLDIESILTSLQVNVAVTDELTAENVEVNLTGKSILVAEDSPIFQKAIKRYFEDMGARVVMAQNGKEALDYLQKDDFHLLFTDIEMPILNGIGLARQVREQAKFQNLPIIFNTSISNPGLIDDISKENLGEYIVKFDEKSIAESVRKVFNLKKAA